MIIRYSIVQFLLSISYNRFIPCYFALWCRGKEEKKNQANMSVLGVILK